ncbi:TldD/PmbA family protein [bacterium]|nr:TldD/PmbA family protein [bacterium]
MTVTSKHLAERVLSLSQAAETEVLVAERESHLTRFANSEIHQNVSERNTEVRVRVIEGGRVGVASTNDLSEASLARLVERARMLARYAPPCDLPPLPGPQRYAAVPHAYAAATAAATPEDRARVAGVACRLALAAGLNAFGAFETAAGRRTIANSRGLFVTQEATKADYNLVVMGADSSGYSSFTAADVAGLDAEALAWVAINKALKSAHPVAIEPGAYTVLLEEDAVADLLDHVAAAGFGGQGLVDGVSFVAGRLGDRLFGSNVTVWDDPLGAEMLPAAFDAEGVGKERLCLIEKGVVRGVAHDSFTAHQLGVASTGHAFPAPSTSGPHPSHLRLEAGDATKADMLRGIERGILVTRFHYTNLADAHTATITGMTRDGTFLIENGEVTRPLKNLRFTSGGIDALNNVRAIARDTKLVPGWYGATRAPALVVDGFRFSGATLF